VGEIDMSVTSRFEPFDRESVFYDSETWEALFGEALKDKPDLADRIARLLFRVVRELEDTKSGRQRVTNTLKLGLECIYMFTDSHRLSFQGFLYHLEGLLVPGDTPEDMMKALILRVETAALRSSTEDVDAKQPGDKKPRKRGKPRKA
jgi:hypothetical protein